MFWNREIFFTQFVAYFIWYFSCNPTSCRQTFTAIFSYTVSLFLFLLLLFFPCNVSIVSNKILTSQLLLAQNYLSMKFKIMNKWFVLCKKSRNQNRNNNTQSNPADVYKTYLPRRQVCLRPAMLRYISSLQVSTVTQASRVVPGHALKVVKSLSVETFGWSPRKLAVGSFSHIYDIGKRLNFAVYQDFNNIRNATSFKNYM